MNIDKLCKDCLNCHKCIEDGYVDRDGMPVKLKDRFMLESIGKDIFLSIEEAENCLLRKREERTFYI